MFSVSQCDGFKLTCGHRVPQQQAKFMRKEKSFQHNSICFDGLLYAKVNKRYEICWALSSELFHSLSRDSKFIYKQKNKFYAALLHSVGSREENIKVVIESINEHGLRNGKASQKAKINFWNTICSKGKNFLRTWDELRDWLTIWRESGEKILKVEKFKFYQNVCCERLSDELQFI